MNAEENPMQKIVTRCWEDEAFKQQLMADPNGVLKAEGAPVPEGITVKVVEDTDRLVHLVIPNRRAELSDAAIDAVAGGSCTPWWDVDNCPNAMMTGGDTPATGE
jgi:hypothetical protein